MSERVQKVAQVASDGPKSFAVVTPLRNVGDRLVLDVQPMQPVNGFGASLHFGVPSFKVIADDLDAPAGWGRAGC
jgi:hypothetical protein